MSDELGEVEADLCLPESGFGFRTLAKVSFWESQKRVVIDIRREHTSDEWCFQLTRDSAIALAHQLLTAAKA